MLTTKDCVELSCTFWLGSLAMAVVSIACFVRADGIEWVAGGFFCGISSIQNARMAWMYWKLPERPLL